MEIRINKFLAKAGIGSRRKVEEKLWSREFSVNGKLAIPGQLIDTEVDVVTYKGAIITPPQIEYVYYLLNKPAGYVSTVSDEFKRKTVLDLVPKKGRLYPVGRLDKDSTGLILITNDGDLALKLSHPKYHISKTYFVTTQEKIMLGQLRKLSEGVNIQKKTTLPAETKRLSTNTFEIILHQGMKRQIRQMCNEVGLTVIGLQRTKIGELGLGKLNPGEYRKLTQNELNSLQK